MSIHDPDGKPASATPAMPWRGVAVGPSDSSAFPYAPLGVTGAVPRSPARAPQGGSSVGPSGARSGDGEVLVCDLTDPRFKGPRVRFGGVAGPVRGIAQTMGLALRPDGSTTGRAGAQKLILVDDRGQDHHLDFTSTDHAHILD